MPALLEYHGGYVFHITARPHRFFFFSKNLQHVLHHLRPLKWLFPNRFGRLTTDTHVHGHRNCRLSTNRQRLLAPVVPHNIMLWESTVNRQT